MEKECDKKYMWVIENFSPLQTEEICSNQFIVGDYKWRFMVNPEEFKERESLSVHLGVADFESLPSGWRIHAKIRLTIVNQLQKKLSQEREIQQWFDQNGVVSSFDFLLPLTELHAKNGGFLVNGDLMIVAEIEFLEVIGKFNVIDETSPVMELVDVNGFQVPLSQVESVKRLFDSQPNIVLYFRLQNPCLKTTYMSLLLGITKTLSQSPQDISKDDLAGVSAAMVSLKVVGFKLDWLEKKLEEVKERKEKAKVVETRIHKIDEKLKDLKEKLADMETLLEKEKADILAEKEKVDILADSVSPKPKDILWFF